MNTHDIDIELPPLPEARIVSYQTDSTMRRIEPRAYSDKDMKDYASAAIEADRKRRGEPVAWRRPSISGRNRWIFAYAREAAHFNQGGWEPLYAAAPQPESQPLTFTQGVLCSLSILDRYGDSIAYREVADPHDLNQLWAEADEFDREHLARHGFCPVPAAQGSGDA